MERGGTVRDISDPQLIKKTRGSNHLLLCRPFDKRRSSSFSCTKEYPNIHSGWYLYMDNFRAVIAVWHDVSQIGRYSVRPTCLPGSKVQDP